MWDLVAGGAFHGMHELARTIHATKEAPLVKEAYLISESSDEFGAAREQFAHQVSGLQSGAPRHGTWGGGEAALGARPRAAEMFVAGTPRPSGFAGSQAGGWLVRSGAFRHFFGTE